MSFLSHYVWACDSRLFDLIQELSLRVNVEGVLGAVNLADYGLIMVVIVGFALFDNRGEIVVFLTALVILAPILCNNRGKIIFRLTAQKICYWVLPGEESLFRREHITTNTPQYMSMILTSRTWCTSY